MQFSDAFKLNPGQFVDETHKKSLVVLHHTVGGSAKSTVNYWNSDEKRIGTAFVVERDGTIYRTFPEDKWAYHVGSKLGNDIDRRSIGIEIASEGGLKEVDGKLYCFDVVSPRTQFRGDVYNHGAPWRGFRCFAAYTDQQIEATLQLVDYLCNKFGIPKTVPKINDYNKSHYNHIGIIGHYHVRADKSDIHPGFPLNRIV